MSSYFMPFVLVLILISLFLSSFFKVIGVDRGRAPVWLLPVVCDSSAMSRLEGQYALSCMVLVEFSR